MGKKQVLKNKLHILLGVHLDEHLTRKFQINQIKSPKLEVKQSKKLKKNQEKAITQNY